MRKAAAMENLGEEWGTFSKTQKISLIYSRNRKDNLTAGLGIKQDIDEVIEVGRGWIMHLL